MSKHLGKRERVAGKRKRRGCIITFDAIGVVTLKLGRKKFSEFGFGSNLTSVQLQKKFRGCVVNAEK